MNSKKKDTPLEAYKYAFFDKKNKQHLYVLSLAKQIGWECEHQKTGKMVADLELLGRFISTKTKSKKPLKQQTPIELQSTIYSLEQTLKK